jgi:hypothetical protein
MAAAFTSEQLQQANTKCRCVTALIRYHIFPDKDIYTSDAGRFVKLNAIYKAKRRFSTFPVEALEHALLTDIDDWGFNRFVIEIDFNGDRWVRSVLAEDRV